MPRPEEFPIKFQFAITKEMDSAINDWRRKQDDLPNRSAAIRRLVDRGLGGRSIPVIVATGDAPKSANRKASDMAGEQIDKLGDSSATAEERQTRKRRLLKGPPEFRDLRVDHPKPKGTTRKGPRK
jgi:hypothetical protein